MLEYIFILIVVALKGDPVDLLTHILEKGHFSRLFLCFLDVMIDLSTLRCSFTYNLILLVNDISILLVHLFNSFLLN